MPPLSSLLESLFSAGSESAAEAAVDTAVDASVQAAAEVVIESTIQPFAETAISPTADLAADTAIGHATEDTGSLSTEGSTDRAFRDTLTTVHMIAQPITEIAFETAIDSITGKDKNVSDESASPGDA